MSKSKSKTTLADTIYAIATDLEAVLRYVGKTGDPTSEHYAEVVSDLCIAYGKTVSALAADILTRETARPEHIELVNRVILEIPTLERDGKTETPTEAQIAEYRAEQAATPPVPSDVRYDVIAWRKPDDEDGSEPVNVAQHVGLTFEELRARVGAGVIQ